MDGRTSELQSPKKPKHLYDAINVEYWKWRCRRPSEGPPPLYLGPSDDSDDDNNNNRYTCRGKYETGREGYAGKAGADRQRDKARTLRMTSDGDIYPRAVHCSQLAGGTN